MKDKVKMNLIQQDVFIRAESPAVDIKKDYLISSYTSSDEVVQSDGVKIVNTVQEYPITPESVNSYADGTNYRIDPSAAASRGAPGVNVGDVAALQDLFSKSPDEIASALGALREKILASRVQPASTESTTTEDNK